jgi:phage shock protein C
VGDRLYRSPTDRVIAGVAGGLATWLRIDPSLIRVVWVLAAIFSGGLLVLVYIVMMIVVPLPPEGWVPGSPSRATPGGNAVPGWDAGTSGWGAGGPQPAPGGYPGEPAWPQSAAPSPASSAPSPTWSAPPQATRDTARGARLAGGWLLILLGIWLLVAEYVNIDWNLLWPVLVIAAGALLIVVALRRRGG